MATNQHSDPVTAMYSRMLTLRNDLSLGSGTQSPALDETFEAFGVTIEELRVSEEHLIHANEMLLTTRHQLEAERRRYRELFDLAPDAYLVTDDDGVILAANRAASVLLKVRQQFLVGKVLANFVFELDRRGFRTMLSELGRDAASTPWQTRLKPRHGEPVEVEVSVSPGTGLSRDGREWLWLFRDLTGRRPRSRVAKDPTAAERDRLRDLLDSVGIVIWEVDPDTGRLTFVSREIESLLGCSAESYVDEPESWEARIHPDDRPVVASLRARQLADRTDLELEYRILSSDERAIWVRDISRFCPGADGEPATIRGVLININKRKRIERRLHYTKNEAEAQIRDLQLLQELCERLTLAIERAELLDEILLGVSSILGAEMASISLYNPERNEIRIVAGIGLPEGFQLFSGVIRPGDTPCSRVLAERRCLAFPDIEIAPEYEGTRENLRLAGVRAVYAIPLLSLKGDALGVINAYFNTPHRPSERPQTLVELYARQAGQLLANAQRAAAARSLSIELPRSRLDDAG